MIAVVTFGIMPLGGCATTGVSPVNFSVIEISGHDRAAVFEAAEARLFAEGYRIDLRDPGKGLIRSVPVDGPPEERLLRRGAYLSGHGRTRRIAELRLIEATEAIRVHCRVAVQEQQTQAQRFFAYERRADDTPGDTAIDRDAATTDDQNTVWRTIRRDRAAERSILASIQSGLGGR
jgi:hypothetical protein